MSSLSSVLRQRRKELGLTLAQIADLMDVAEATVQRWESGNIKSVRHEKIGKLAEILQVSPSVIMGWDDISTAQGKAPATEGKREEDTNIIRIAGRDGSYAEKRLTDEQLAAIKAIIDQLPEADDL